MNYTYSDCCLFCNYEYFISVSSLHSAASQLLTSVFQLPIPTSPHHQILTSPHHHITTSTQSINLGEFKLLDFLEKRPISIIS